MDDHLVNVFIHISFEALIFRTPETKPLFTETVDISK